MNATAHVWNRPLGSMMFARASRDKLERLRPFSRRCQ